MLRRRTLGVASFAAATIVAFSSLTASAETLQSNSYMFDETSVGTSGLLNSKSTNYGITEATGDLGAGEAASSNYNLQTGSKTSVDPTLSFSVDQFTADFSKLNPLATSTATARFSVLNYSSWGYSVQLYGPPPTYRTRPIAAIATAPASSQPGTEQFGVNLVANTSPVSIGANVDNGDYGLGVVSPDYNQSNKYRYISGETIASAPKSSGKSIYTLSYIVNVAGNTPGGAYTSNQMLVVTGTY